jgi:hypothetical protein
VKAAFDALGMNLQAGDLTSCIKVHEETPVMQRVCEENIAAFVKMGRHMMNLEPVTQEVTQKIILMIPVK